MRDIGGCFKSHAFLVGGGLWSWACNTMMMQTLSELECGSWSWPKGQFVWVWPGGYETEHGRAIFVESGSTAGIKWAQLMRQPERSISPLCLLVWRSRLVENLGMRNLWGPLQRGQFRGWGTIYLRFYPSITFASTRISLRIKSSTKKYAINKPSHYHCPLVI